MTNRLLTGVLDPAELPAREAVVMYHRRWEQELTVDEIRTHLNGRDVLLRGKTPRGVVQDRYGMMVAHRIIRRVMGDAAARVEVDSDRLSFADALRIVPGRLPEAPGQTAAWYRGPTGQVSRQVLTTTWTRARLQPSRPA